MPAPRTIPTSQTPDVVTVSILSDGQAIPQTVSVKEILIRHEVNKIPWAKIRVEDGDQSKEDFEISDQSLLIPGKSIEVQIGYRSNNNSLFKGIVIQHSNKIAPKKSELVIECRDAAVKMTIGRRSKHYNNVTDSDVAEELIDRYSLDKDVTSTTVQYKDLVQYDTTDWDFMLSRIDRIGMICIVSDGKVTIQKPDLTGNSALDLLFGATIVDYFAEIDARLQVQGMVSASWDYSNQQVKETNATEPTINQEPGNIANSDLANVIGLQSWRMVHSGKLAEEDQQAWADARLQKQRLAKIRGMVKFQGFPGLLPGQYVTLNGVGDRFNGPVFVNAVEHHYKEGDWHTEVQFGMGPEWFAETINPYHPTASVGIIPVPQGLTIGVVSDLQDPDSEDRVKVKLPMVNASEDGVWARVAAADAGDQRGLFFRPEVGDEVICGFVHDDPSQVLILGMLNSSNKPAPIKASSSNDEKGYTSREKLKFTFNDADKSIILETPAGKKITLDENSGSIQIEDENSNKITMDSSGITISSGSDLQLKGTSSVKIEAPNISINGSAMTEVKGGLVKIN